jgi:hypothetical protein
MKDDDEAEHPHRLERRDHEAQRIEMEPLRQNRAHQEQREAEQHLRGPRAPDDEEDPVDDVGYDHDVEDIRYARFEELHVG